MPSYEAGGISTDTNEGNNGPVVIIKKNYTVIYVLIAAAVVLYLSSK